MASGDSQQPRKNLADCLFKEHRIRILEQLEPQPILDHLRQEDVISEDDEERINAKATRKDKVRALIDLLYLRMHHPMALDEFLKAVKENQLWLHNELFATSPEASSENTLRQQLQTCYSRKKGLSLKHPWATERSSSLPDGLYTKLRLINDKDSSVYRNAFTQYSAFQDFCTDNLTEIRLEDLFKKGAHGTRILLEGDAGIGKTSVCHRLIQDFSASEVDENHKYFIHDLLFVFVIEIRYFRDSLKDTLQRALSLSAQEINELWLMIQNKQRQCLFILDGLDEKTREFPKEIRDLIEGTLFCESLVLATCRTNQANDLSEFFDHIVINVGFAIQQAFEYVQKYFLLVQIPGITNSGEKAENVVVDNAEILGDLLRTPLNCLLICLWLEEWIASSSHNQPILEGKRMTSTNLFEMVVRSINKRYCKKEGIKLERGRIPHELKEDLVKLYKLALYGVLTEKYKFTIQDLQDHGISEKDNILDLGFLTREYSVSALEEEDDVGYSFPHRSLQDFFAANAIGHLPEPLKWLFVTYFAQNWKIHDHVCLFLCGLLQNDMLLKWLLCCTLKNSTFRVRVASQLTESQESDYARCQAFIKSAVTKAKHVVRHLACSFNGIAESDYLSLSGIQQCVNTYLPSMFIWCRTESGKLNEVLSLYLRGMYEMPPSALSEMIRYLMHLSDGTKPPWDIIQECTPEVRTIIVKLLSTCDSLNLERVIFPHDNRVRDNAWHQLFRQDGCQIKDLDLTFNSTSDLVDILGNFDSQINIEKLTLNCIQHVNTVRQDPGNLSRIKKVEQIRTVKERITEMSKLKSLSIAGRTAGSCIGFLPLKTPLDEVIFMILDWPQGETEELIQEAMSCQIKKLTLSQRTPRAGPAFSSILQTFHDVGTRTGELLAEIQLQFFDLLEDDQEQYHMLKQLVESRSINLRLTECRRIVQRVDSIHELKACLSMTGMPREGIIVHRILNISESVYADAAGCSSLFAVAGELDWTRLGDKPLEIQEVLAKLLQSAVNTNATTELNLQNSDFEQYISPALESIKAIKIKLSLVGNISDYSIDRFTKSVMNRGGDIKWETSDLYSHRAVVRFPRNLCSEQDDCRLLIDFPEVSQ